MPRSPPAPVVVYTKYKLIPHFNFVKLSVWIHMGGNGVLEKVSPLFFVKLSACLVNFTTIGRQLSSRDTGAEKARDRENNSGLPTIGSFRCHAKLLNSTST
jgi:hypothetical protein